MRVEEKIHLNKFKPRSYQLPLIEALEKKGYRRILAILPRRAGKDITAFNMCIRECLRKPCVIYYIFPTYSQAKKVIWDSITNDGKSILDFIPPSTIASKNATELKVRFKNGSLFQLVGSDNFDSLMGTNPAGCVFSEYALQDPRAYQYIRPILTANDGWAIFISTPRGKNHLWELYQIALNSPDWFCLKLTVEDTHHISLRAIAKEKDDGIMSDDLIQQEYYTSFDMGVEGAYYAKYLDRLRVNGQISHVPFEPGFKVHTAWDLGMRDSTTIIFFQQVGMTVRIIDCYENSKEGLEHYIAVLDEKPYKYGKHIAPHDIKVREFGSGMSRLDKARQLGITFTIAPDVSVMDGIEAVRTVLPKCWFDTVKCEKLIKSLENYRQEYDVKKKVYKMHPLHDWSSHFCFVGSTKIVTRYGMRQIMDIQDKTEVLTLEGWQECLPAQSMRKNAPLVEVMFQDGMKVKCTPDHLFLTEELGWRSAEHLGKAMKIQSSLMQLPSILMERFIGYMLENDTFQTVVGPCIELFGEMPLEIFQEIVIYITRTMMPNVMHYGISYVPHDQFIYQCLGQMEKDFPAKLVKQLKNGINQKKGASGTSEMRNEQKDGQNGSVLQKIVSIVSDHMKLWSEKMGIPKNSVTPTAKLLRIESVRSLDETADVWCINVPAIKHFSLENGAVVHNSDSMRYLCISLPRTQDGLTSDDIERNYREAMYGGRQEFATPFRKY